MSGGPDKGKGHLALYRAWRPVRFGEVVGQEHVTRTLRNALAAGRAAHAYLFCGPRGTGKTSVAKILARAANCAAPEAGEPCGRCPACETIASDRALDVLEIDAASHRGIEEIRDLREKVKYAPAALRRRVYIIDEVHMLTTEAFNALLKTLEEPPPHALFILATTDPHKVPATIVSRCQRFDFHRLGREEMVGRLREVVDSLGVRAGDAVLHRIARHADGGLRDALSLLDQCVAFAGDEVTVEHLQQLLGTADREEVLAAAGALAAGDAAALLAAVDEVHRRGRDLRQFARDLVGVCRDALFVQVAPGDDPAGGEVSPEGLEPLTALPQARLLALVQGLSRLEGELRWAVQARLHLEVGLLALMPEPAAAGGVGTGADAAGQARRETAAAAASQPARSRAPGAPAPAGGGRAPARGPAAARPPASAPPMSAPAAAGSGEAGAPLSLAAVQAAWPEVRARVKEAQTLLNAMLEPARPAALRGSELVLAFGPKWSFHRGRVAEPASRALIERALQEVLGRPLRVSCVLEGEAPGAAPAAGVDPEVAAGEAAAGEAAAAVNTAAEARAPSGPPAPPSGASGAPEPGAASAPDVSALLAAFGGECIEVDIEPEEE